MKITKSYTVDEIQKVADKFLAEIGPKDYGKNWSVFRVEDFGPKEAVYIMEGNPSINDVCRNLEKKMRFEFHGSSSFGNGDKKWCHFTDVNGKSFYLLIGPKHV